MKAYFLTIFSIAMLASGAGYAQQTLQIAAVVNDDAISMTDVEDRIKLVVISSGLPNSPDIRAKVMPQVVDGLIEEQIKLQAAARNKLTISDDEVNDGLKIIASQNKFEPDQFVALMKKGGIPVSTLLHQIKAQLAWNKVIKEKLRKQVDVTDVDTNARIERLKSKIGQTEYLVSEIFLPLDGKRDGEVRQFAQRMATELQAKKAPFGAVAAQFSKTAGAEKGGSLGWIQEGFLDPELEKVLLPMAEGQVSDPIQVNNGLYLLLLQKKRTITEESIPPRDEIANTIGFERLDRIQQRELLDLKSSAFIDRRV